MKLYQAMVAVTLVGLSGLFGCGGPNWSLVDESRAIDRRPVYLGYALPYPVSVPPLGVGGRTYGTLAPQGMKPLVSMVIQIDSLGTVTGVTPVSPGDSAYVAFYRPWLEQHRFEPGRVGDSVSSMSLLVDVLTHTFDTKPMIRFPVDPNRTINRRELYWRALELQSVEVPEIVRFPSYYYELNPKQRWRPYPLKVFRLDLDSLGQVQAVEPAFETDSKFSRQIRSAIHWGEYTPLRIDGRAVASSNFLIVSLYPMVKYPTCPIDRAVAEPTLWDRSRVMLVSDTAGVILPPVPKGAWSEVVVDSFYQGMTPELVSSRISVGLVGNGRLSQVRTDFFRASHILNQNTYKIRFFPAKRLNGSPRTFEGMVYLRYIDAANVRIWFDWLGGSDPGPPAQDPESQ